MIDRQPGIGAIQVIRDDHDRLGAVLHGMRYLVRSIDRGEHAPDLKVFRAMLLYISDYPEKVHHPREDHFLFDLLRKRTHEADQTLDELEAQHARGDALIREMEHALAHYELEGGSVFKPFLALVEEFASFYFDHMRLEENGVLPVAQRYLQPSDWQQIEAAFADPGATSGHEKSLGKVFSLIVNLAPPPIGVGQAA